MLSSAPVFLLMGPTASGKTDIVIELSKYYPLEIISVDSVMIYNDMNIGSNKPTIDILKELPHHLINIRTPLESYSVAEFIKDASLIINEIIMRNHIPILAGGNMMYFNALINGISTLPSNNIEIRNEIEYEAEKIGWLALHNKLKNIDHVTASKISVNDKQRIMRALEVYYLTGKTLHELQQIKDINPSEYTNFIPLSIIPDSRIELNKRIHDRFISMMQQGLIEEVKALKIKYPKLTNIHQSIRSVGYYSVWQFLEEKQEKIMDINILQEIAINKTRQLSKRQITWLKSLSSSNIAHNNPTLNIIELAANVKEIFKQTLIPR